MMKCNLTMSAIATVCLTLLLVGTASADAWPTSVSGNWNVRGNHAPGVLSITQFAGATGSQCKPIRGLIYGVDAIEGFYCPGSGRIAFMRYAGNSTAPKQFWSGNLSTGFAGEVHKMGGGFAVFVHNNVGGTIGGLLGEYNFDATK